MCAKEKKTKNNKQTNKNIKKKPKPNHKNPQDQYCSAICWLFYCAVVNQYLFLILFLILNLNIISAYFWFPETPNYSV